MFQGLRDFRTTVAAELREDLRRLNLFLVQAFEEEERNRPRVWRVVRTTDEEYQAQHWDAVRAGVSRDARVLLPRSDPKRAGHCVRVARGPQGATFFGVTVVAQSQESINGSSALTIGVGFGFREYMDMGDGTWFSSPVI